MRGLWIPFPNVEFQALLTEIASHQARRGVRLLCRRRRGQIHQGLCRGGTADKIPLFGSGFLTDGVLDAVDNAAEGLETTLHYGDGLNSQTRQSVSAPPTTKLTKSNPTFTPCKATTPVSCLPRVSTP